ncbi:MAG: glycine zipper 2TM domain-containing protein [Ottowia sp.]|nr:glycine zipper 2TM domain-containing protein [Ottowia sp.]
MIVRKPVISLAAAVAATALLVGCANQPMGGGYATPQAQGSYGARSGQYAQYGRVTNVQYVRGSGSDGVVGTVAGGAAGGLLGHQVGKGRGRTAATIAGAIGGALIGNAIERSAGGMGGQPVYRVTVQFDDGSVRDFDYAESPNVSIGDRVRAEGNQLYR